MRACPVIVTEQLSPIQTRAEPSPSKPVVVAYEYDVRSATCTVITRSRPCRLMRTGSFSPGVITSASGTAPGTPSLPNATIVSPASSPACAAGLPASTDAITDGERNTVNTFPSRSSVFCSPDNVTPR